MQGPVSISSVSSENQNIRPILLFTMFYRGWSLLNEVLRVYLKLFCTFFQFLAPATLLTYWPPIRLAQPTRSRLEISPLLFTSPTPLGNTAKPFKPSRLSRIHPRKRSSPQSTFQTHKYFRWLEKMASLLLCIILTLSKIAFMQS